MLIGINGGYFPAICRVCFNLRSFKSFWEVTSLPNKITFRPEPFAIYKKEWFSVLLINTGRINLIDRHQSLHIDNNEMYQPYYSNKIDEGIVTESINCRDLLRSNVLHFKFELGSELKGV